MSSIIYSKEQWPKENLKNGEHYAGIILASPISTEGPRDIDDRHLILLPGEFVGTWDEAHTWARKQNGHLPTQRQQALLYANLKEQFQPALYWSAEQYAADGDYAWMQNFSYGYQFGYHQSHECRARAVRTIKID